MSNGHREICFQQRTQLDGDIAEHAFEIRLKQMLSAACRVDLTTEAEWLDYLLQLEGAHQQYCLVCVTCVYVRLRGIF